MTPETAIYNMDQVNKMAQKERHLKVFSRLDIIGRFFLNMVGAFKIPLNYVRSIRFDLDLLPAAPNKRLFSQMAIFTAALFILSAVSPVSNFSTMSMSYSSEYIGTYSLPGDVLITDSDGYLMKINPQTGNASRIGMTDYAIHTVEGGETLSEIAKRFGLNVETIM